MAKRRTWEDDLKDMLRREHGVGWRLREQSGKAQLTQLLERDGQKRKSGDLGIKWLASNQTEILNAVGKVIELVTADPPRPLRDALKLVKSAPISKGGAVDWDEVARQYEQFRVGSGQAKRANYEANERYRIKRCLTLLEQKKHAPSDGPSLLRAYTTAHLLDVTSGGSGRKRNLLDVARFLTFAVKRCGADSRWLPLQGEELSELVGVREVAEQDTPPIKPEQLFALLDSLYESPELRLAVALVGLFGLRPSELMELEVREGHLYVGQTKRNRHSAAKPKGKRLALPLDLNDLPEEGARVLKQYESGLIKLPTSIRNAKDYKDCGDAFRQYLDRHPYWLSLKAEIEGLVPYSLRHGYAWRGAKYYDRSIPIRDLAALMGHTVKTHMKHYGKWTDDEGLMASVQAITKAAASQSKRPKSLGQQQMQQQQ